jgi:ABC-type multidrug transport system fused ATPase/permease subunit
MTLLKELLRKYRRQGLLLFVIGVISTLTGLLFIEMGRRIINVIASSSPGATSNFTLLLIYSSLMLVAIFSSGMIGYWIEVLFARVSQSVLRDIRLKLFNHLLQLPQEFHNKNPVGQIMSLILNDVDYIGQFFSRGLLEPLMNLVMVAFFTAYLSYLNWKLALAAVITVPTVAVFLPGFNRRMASLTEAYSNSMGKISDCFQEAFSGIADIRANQTYHFETARLDRRIMDFFAINLNMAKTSGTLELLMEVVRGSGPLLVYLYGGYLCLRGEMLVGTLVAAITVIYSLYQPVGSFVSFLSEWRQVKVRFDKLEDYLGLTTEPGLFLEEVPKTTPGGAIRFDNVQFGFDEREMLLKDINFSAAPGKRLAIVGTSGSGKSLTAALISRIYQPLSGNITLGANYLEAIPLFDLRSQIGYVSQTPFIFNDTIKVNILYSLLHKPGVACDRLEEWIDFSKLGEINDLAKLTRLIIRIVKEVGLFDDIYELGLRSKLNGGRRDTAMDFKKKIIEARKMFLKEMASQDLQYVEHYQEENFLEYRSLLENIAFSPSSEIIEVFGSTKKFCQRHLNELLRENNLLDKLFNVGIQLAREDSFLVKELGMKKSPLLNYLDINEDTFNTKIKINEKMAFVKEDQVINRIDSSLAGDILDLAYNYIPAKGKEESLDDEIKKTILETRQTFRRNLYGTLKDKINFFNTEECLQTLSLRENIVFGSTDPLRKKANEAINAAIRKVVSEVGIEEEILNLGLEFKVGERGNRLSGGQKQKVAIARILIKNPHIFILDEVTANLDGASQARITNLINGMAKDKTVIAIAHRLNTINDYDQILVFDKGQIVEKGTFEELIKMDGLFKKLFCESNER